MHLVDPANIERAIMNQSRTIRLPVHVIKELNTVLRAKRHLEARAEREPTAEDIAHLVGKDTMKCAGCCRSEQPLRSMRLSM